MTTITFIGEAEAPKRVPWNKGTKRVSHWWDTLWLPVDPDDYAVKRVFTTGQCHSLAFALHRLTGWPIYLLCGEYADSGDGTEGDPNAWSHAVVKAPDGRFVDIDGAWYLEEGRWNDCYPFYVGTPEEALSWIRGSCDTDNSRTVKPFAEAVLSNVRMPA